MRVTSCQFIAWTESSENKTLFRLVFGLLGWMSLAPALCPAQELLPDMVPWVREDSDFLVNWDIQSGRLRMQTMFANIGDGLFQIRTDNEGQGGPTTPVTQRVFIDVDNGPNFVDYFVNTTVNFHGAHGHIHFNDFSEFQLLEALIDDEGVVTVGELVANEVKTSFLLHDSAPIPDPQWEGYPSFSSSNLGRFQNVSVGWGDIYSHGTEGQSISLDGVPVGPLYWLRQIVDPTNVIRELDDTNNSFEILIDLAVPGTALRHRSGDFIRPGDTMPGPDGDLNGDRMVDLLDWVALKQNATADLTGLSDDEAYSLGDLNLDRQHSLADVHLFRQYFDAAHGTGAFAELLAGVPEPSSQLLGILIIFAGTRLRRRKQRQLVAAVIIGTGLMLGVSSDVAWANQQLFYEDFDGLMLGPPVNEPMNTTEAWTDEPPPGWNVDDSGIPSIGLPSQGMPEWEGWSFTDKNWWTSVAFDQGRADFDLGQGIVAVADPDEWDDRGAPASGPNFLGYYNALMTTPAIDLTGVPPGAARLTFVSSWRPECCDDGPTDSNNQTATIRASYDGGSTFTEVVRWESNPESEFYKIDATNERVLIELDNPADATSVLLEFGLTDAGDDWWWALDQVEVFLPLELRVDTTTGTMTMLRAADLTGYEIKSPNQSLNPSGWQQGNFDAQNLGAEPFVSADFNGDQIVSAADYVIWRNAQDLDDRGDANNDGLTDDQDYQIWLEEFGRAIALGGSWETVIAQDNQLLEYFLTGTSTFDEKSIGNGYDTVIDARDLVFTYTLANGQEFVGHVTYLGDESAQASIVPEPGSQILLLVGSLAALVRRVAR